MWVADMDFPAPPAVVAALQDRVAHGVFGYAQEWPSLTQAVLDHLQTQYGWAIQAEWLVWLPGLVTGLNVAAKATRPERRGLLTTTPIYPPFLSAPRHAGAPLGTVPLALADGGWQMDWPALEAACQPETGLYLFCHPHNPVGRAWSVPELEQMAEFILRHDLEVCSDEIHCGLLLEPGLSHRPLASLSPEVAARCITLMAPSKTFNVPGLGCAFAVISDAGLRRRFTRAMAGIVPHVNVLGLVACEAALREGEPWRRELLQVLRRNRDKVQAVVNSIPGLSMTPVEATYLAWMDARDLGHDNPAAFLETQGLGVSDGTEFGAPGWIRLNFGCPETTLDEGLRRLRQACGVD